MGRSHSRVRRAMRQGWAVATITALASLRLIHALTFNSIARRRSGLIVSGVKSDKFPESRVPYHLGLQPYRVSKVEQQLAGVNESLAELKQDITNLYNRTLVQNVSTSQTLSNRSQTGNVSANVNVHVGSHQHHHETNAPSTSLTPKPPAIKPPFVLLHQNKTDFFKAGAEKSRSVHTPAPKRATEKSIMDYFSMNGYLLPMPTTTTPPPKNKTLILSQNISSTDPVTVQDLLAILDANGYLRKADFEDLQQQRQLPTKKRQAEFDFVKESNPSESIQQSAKSSSSSSGVAFPQPSILSYKSLKWGSTVAAAVMGILIGTSIMPNLWLMGGLVAGFYGYDIGKKMTVEQHPPTGALPFFIVSMGRRIAKTYLKVYDTANAVFFMYKTGQLSYEYYKTYAALDDRFAIQSKIDAWNAWFAEGKVAFDKWEKDNEVGRKVLAGLRTVWLVEERSLKKGRRRGTRSRYRIVQFAYDAAFWMGRFVYSVWRVISGGDSAQLREFLQGVRIDMSESKLQAMGTRLRSVGAALISVNLVGALFTISPNFLGLLAVVIGIVWPSWITEFLDRISTFFLETRAKGRGEEKKKISDTIPKITSKSDRNRYHFYKRPNGKKRYYRVGKPMFGPAAASKTKPQDLWPWQVAPPTEKKPGWNPFG